LQPPFGLATVDLQETVREGAEMQNKRMPEWRFRLIAGIPGDAMAALRDAEITS
jgi:hypothetical protein